MPGQDGQPADSVAGARVGTLASASDDKQTVAHRLPGCPLRLPPACSEAGELLAAALACGLGAAEAEEEVVNAGGDWTQVGVGVGQEGGRGLLTPARWPPGARSGSKASSGTATEARLHSWRASTSAYCSRSHSSGQGAALTAWLCRWQQPPTAARPAAAAATRACGNRRCTPVPRNSPPRQQHPPGMAEAGMQERGESSSSSISSSKTRSISSTSTSTSTSTGRPAALSTRRRRWHQRSLQASWSSNRLQTSLARLGSAGQGLQRATQRWRRQQRRRCLRRRRRSRRCSTQQRLRIIRWQQPTQRREQRRCQQSWRQEEEVTRGRRRQVKRAATAAAPAASPLERARLLCHFQRLPPLCLTSVAAQQMSRVRRLSSCRAAERRSLLPQSKRWSRCSGMQQRHAATRPAWRQESWLCSRSRQRRATKLRWRSC